VQEREGASPARREREEASRNLAHRTGREGARGNLAYHAGREGIGPAGKEKESCAFTSCILQARVHLESMLVERGERGRETEERGGGKRVS